MRTMWHDDTNASLCSFVASIGKAAPDTAVLLRTYPSLRDTGLRPKIREVARATSAASSFFDPDQI